MPFSVKTTEITVTTESADEYRLQSGTAGGVEVDLRRAHSVKGDREPDSPTHSQIPGAYSITISSDRHRQNSQDPSSSSSPAAASAKGKPKQVTHQPNPQHSPNSHNPNYNINRHNREINKAAWSYTKCSILFFTALCVTWIPSSANRVYSAVHGHDQVVALQVLSAIVLPLQGFWNAVIYSVTSWAAVKLFFAELLHDRQAASADAGGVSLSRRPHNNERRNMSFALGGVGAGRRGGGSSGGGKNDGDSDSTVDLAGHARSISRSS
jgi:hypothetical protein